MPHCFSLSYCLSPPLLLSLSAIQCIFSITAFGSDRVMWHMYKLVSSSASLRTRNGCMEQSPPRSNVKLIKEDEPADIKSVLMNEKFLLPTYRHLLSTQGHVRSGWSSSQWCGKRKIFSVHHCAVCNTFKASVTITLTLRGNLNLPTNFTLLLWSDSCNWSAACATHDYKNSNSPAKNINQFRNSPWFKCHNHTSCFAPHYSAGAVLTRVWGQKENTPFSQNNVLNSSRWERTLRQEKERRRDSKKNNSPWRKPLWCRHNRLKASTNNRRHSQHRKLNCFIQSPKPN